MPWWISNFPSDGLIIWRYMKYKYHNWGIAWYSPFFRHTQMFVAGCLKGFLWFGKWFVTLSPKLRSSPRWITAFSLGALRFASKHVEIRQRKVPKISDGSWNRFPVPICWRWCQFYSYCRIVFWGIHSIHSDFFSVLIFTRPSIFDFGTPWNEILKILLRSDPQAVNCALSSSSGYLLARKVKVPLQVFRLFLGFAVADSEDHFGSCWVSF